jgi:hypothetical protein
VLKLGDMGVAAVVSRSGTVLQTHLDSRHVAGWFKTKPFASDAYSIAWVLLDMLALTNDTDPNAENSQDEAELRALLASKKSEVAQFYPAERDLLLPLLDAAIRMDLHRPAAGAKRPLPTPSVAVLRKQLESTLRRLLESRKGGRCSCS